MAFNMVFPVMGSLENSLPYFMDGVGFNYEQEDVARPFGHPYYQWIQSHQGSGELTLNGKKYIISEGSGMLLFPGEPHFYKRTGEKWIVDWIIFRGPAIESFIKNVANINASSVYSVPFFCELTEKIKELYLSALDGGPASSLTCSGLVYVILTYIMRLSSSLTASSIEVKNRLLAPVLSYIHQNSSKSFTLEELADIAGVTPQHLCAAFKKYVSHTPFEYINMLKIKRSKELIISDKNMSVKEAAYRVGFNDPAYFCRVFRRFEGMTPGEFAALYGGRRTY